MLFAHLERISGWTDYDYADQMVPTTSSSSQQPPRTSGSLPSWCQCRSENGSRYCLSHLGRNFFNGIGHKQTSDVRLQGSAEIARRRAYKSAEGLGESGRRRISGCERNFTDR